MKTTKTLKLNKGFGIQTREGHIFDPKSGILTQIDINDIAHALSNICRYSGHCRKFYSVAEHSVLVSRIIAKRWPDDKEAIWAGFLHDATEAYVTDLPTPIKVLVPEYIEIENKLTAVLAKEFGVQWNPHTTSLVKVADLTALATEARLLFEDVSHWDTIREYDSECKLLAEGFPLAPADAKKLFMKEFNKLKKERNRE